MPFPKTGKKVQANSAMPLTAEFSFAPQFGKYQFIQRFGGLRQDFALTSPQHTLRASRIYSLGYHV